jgi:hypothetical protein
VRSQKDYIMSEQPEIPDKRTVSNGAAVDRVLAVMFGGEVASQEKSNKRIVSKEEYAVLVGKREAKRWGSIVLAVAAAGCFVCTIIGVLAMIGGFTMGFLVAGLSVVLGLAMKKVAEKAMSEVLITLDVVPLTRANMGDLSAPDTLVRASEAPSQTELLRAAAQGQETPAEELLRAGEENGQDV